MQIWSERSYYPRPIYLHHFIFIAQLDQIIILATMKVHFAACQVWSDASMTRAPAIIRHSIMWHHLQWRLLHVLHHFLHWRWRTFYFVKLRFLILISCGMQLELLINFVDLHLILHNLHELAYFSFSRLLLIDLNMFSRTCRNNSTLYVLLYELGRFAVDFCDSMLHGSWFWRGD